MSARELQQCRQSDESMNGVSENHEEAPQLSYGKDFATGSKQFVPKSALYDVGRGWSQKFFKGGSQKTGFQTPPLKEVQNRVHPPPQRKKNFPILGGLIPPGYSSDVDDTTKMCPSEVLSISSKQSEVLSISSKQSSYYTCKSSFSGQEDDFATSSNQAQQYISGNIHGTRQFGNPHEWNSWTIPKRNLRKKDELGRGSYGRVYLGIWNGKTEVACKQMFYPKTYTKEEKKNFNEGFIREVEFLLQLRHPNIVQFYGANPDAKCIVTEYVKHGSVYNLLHGNQGDQNLRNLVRNNLGVRLDIAKQAALGLQFLHGKQICHLDFKTQNLLVGESYNHIHIKVCDFGLARIKIELTNNSQGSVGTPEYMAPEVLRNCEKSEKADIYSFGVVLHELVTLSPPWYEVWAKLGDMAQYNVWYQIAVHNKKLKIPEDVDERIKKLILKCWADKPSDRPSIDEIIVELEELLKIYPTRKVFVC